MDNSKIVEIGGKPHLKRTDAPEYIGIKQSSLDKVITKSRNGHCEPPLKIYQPMGKGSAIYIAIEDMDEWMFLVKQNGGVKFKTIDI